MRVTAKGIITEVLSVAEATGEPRVRVGVLIDACAIFGFSANTVRVSLVHMRADGTVESPERACYRLGGSSRELSQRVMGWREVAERAVVWDGSWIGFFDAHLSRTDRVALRKRTRALRLLGFRALEEGLHLRPNNLRGGIAEVRAGFARLGVEPDAIVARIEELSERDAERAPRLWDGPSIVEGYRELLRRLAESEASLGKLSLEEAMRETFLLGREVIRSVALDPLLPTEMASTEAREALVEAMIRYDEKGQRLWRRYLGVAQSEEAA